MDVLAKGSIELRLRDTWDWVLLGASTSNVIMQLALKPVGYGVAESVVDSGNVMLHPIKRLRTTLSYLAVAIYGTDEEKERFRREVDVSHRYVHSAPGAAVKYNAFDPELQLWVAACLYQGFVLGHEALQGPLDEASADAIYAEAVTLGTTLQVKPDMWPPNREAFEEYWTTGLGRTEIDDFTRAYFWRLLDLEMLPRWQRLRPRVALNHFINIGFLPAELREQMRVEWSDSDQARFERLFRAIGRVSRFQPRWVREFPLNLLMWDLRRRIRRGKPMIGTMAPIIEVTPGVCPM